MNTTLPPPSPSLNINSTSSNNAMSQSSLSPSVDTSINPVSYGLTLNSLPTVTSTPNISFNPTNNGQIDKPKVKPTKRKIKAAEQKKLANQLNSSNLSPNDILNLFNSQLNASQLGNQFASQLSNQLSNQLNSHLLSNQFANQFNCQFGGQLTGALTNHSNGLLNGGLMNNHDLSNSNRLQSHQSMNSNTTRPDSGNKSKSMMNDESSIINKSSAINHLNQQLNNGCGTQQSVNSSTHHTIKDDKDNCKQVLCDQNGFVLSEIIYRCRICLAIHEYQADARHHYHIKHMGAEYPANFNNLSNLANLNNLRNLTANDLNSLNNLNMMNGLNGIGNSLVNQNFNNNNAGNNQQMNNLQLNLQNGLNSLSLISNNSIENLYNDESTNSNINGTTNDAIDETNNTAPMSGFLDTLNNCNSKHNLSNLNLNSKQMTTALTMYANSALNSNNNSLFQNNLNHLNQLPQSSLCISNIYSNDQHMMNAGLADDEGFYSNNSSLVNNSNVDAIRSTGKSGRAAESCTKSGFITCPVCGQCRYYTTLQRRYGQFTCVACYRFFKDFFNKPTIYICPTLSKCRLKCKQRCKACWISSCINLYTVDSKRQEILMKFKPRKSIDEIDGEAEAQLAIMENLDMNDQSLSNTNNNTPTSMLNEDDDLDEDEAGNSLEDESFPLDFSSKKLMENEQTNGSDELNCSNKSTNETCDIICKIERQIDETNDDQQSNNNITSPSNEPKEDDSKLDDLRADEPGFEEPKQETHPFKAQESNQFSQFTTSSHNFMRFGQLCQTNQQDQLTDWNNNSVSDSQIFDNFKTNLTKLSNGLTNANDLNALNLSMIHENDNSSPVKKRSKSSNCSKCENCLAEDCGECTNCLDEKKKRCEKKMCLEKTSMVKV